MLDLSDTTNLSLIAFYGAKDLALRQLILNLQQLLLQQFKNDFVPYEINQVHATIIGCEGFIAKAGIINKWFYELRKEVKYIEYPDLINYFCSCNLLPVNISFGGYQLQKNYQFLSRKQHPTNRSFQIQKAAKNLFLPVLIGWSLKEETITTDIELIRKDLQQFNYLHKYHKSAQDIDNDLYLRIGTIKQISSLDSIPAIQKQIVNYLQAISPTIIPLNLKNLALVKYQDVSLPISTTKIYSLTDLKSNISKLQQLYR